MFYWKSNYTQRAAYTDTVMPKHCKWGLCHKNVKQKRALAHWTKQSQTRPVFPSSFNSAHNTFQVSQPNVHSWQKFGDCWCKFFFWTDNMMNICILKFLTYTHTHTRLTALFPGLPGWAGTRKVKPIWILLKQETVSGSGIRWAICKSAPHSRQITMPAPHHSVFYSPFYRPTNSVKALKA